MMDYSLLLGTLRTHQVTYGDLAKGIGISRGALSNKLKGKTDFTATEIVDIMQYLCLDMTDVTKYFFNVLVEKRE